MQTPGPLEIVVILVVALLVFGPNKLPEIGRQAGKAMREFRRFQSSFRDEVRDFVDPDKPTVPKKWEPKPEDLFPGEVVDAEIVTEPAAAPTPGPAAAPAPNSSAETPPQTERPEDTSPGPTTA